MSTDARATLARPAVAGTFAALAAAAAALWLWRGTPVATRDVLGDAPGPVTTLIRHGLLFVAPLADDLEKLRRHLDTPHVPEESR